MIPFDLSTFDNCTSFSDLALEYQILSNPRVNSSTLVGETLTDDINVITWFVKDNGNETNCQFELRLVDSTRPIFIN